MEIQSQEARIILAIEAIRSSKKLSRRSAAKLYNVPYTTLSYRMTGRTSRRELKANCHKLTEVEEEVIIRYILDLDTRGFAPRLAGVEDIAKLYTRIAWRTTRRMVVTRADRRGRGKAIQPGNREWATAIVCVNSEGSDIPPFLVIQGKNHLASWYTDGGLPQDWVIKPTSNGWTNNETGLEWLKHFDKHTRSRTKGTYRMLSITTQNAKAGFRGAGLVPFDPQVIISKLDVKLRTPTPTGPPSADADPWVSQTPQNPTDALSQTTLVKNRIAQHQGSSPTPIFQTVAALAKGTERLAHENTLLAAEVRTLRKANEALSKRRRAKRTRVYQGGALTVEDALDVLDQKDVDAQIHRDKRLEGSGQNIGQPTMRRCSTCGKTGHNARTCQEGIDMCSSLDSE
ncbi:hypothetical protein V493_05796 [Pseudogymnoascus sp. VKM F-4281 (FW-2241)]|nr:hypothetical protein V493_05796 [Pseudogymnoascus sp. VKM F-4281 (FW-2241)]